MYLNSDVFAFDVTRDCESSIGNCRWKFFFMILFHFFFSSHVHEVHSGIDEGLFFFVFNIPKWNKCYLELIKKLNWMRKKNLNLNGKISFFFVHVCHIIDLWRFFSKRKEKKIFNLLIEFIFVFEFIDNNEPSFWSWDFYICSFFL